MADGRSTRTAAAARRFEKIREENEVKRRSLFVLNNHPVLRTAFDSKVPRAFFSPRSDLPLAARYARPDEKLASAVKRCAGEAVRAPFLQAEVPALRAILVHAEFGESRQVALLLVAHASIAAERSLEYVLKEIDDPAATLQADEDFFS